VRPPSTSVCSLWILPFVFIQSFSLLTPCSSFSFFPSSTDALPAGFSRCAFPQLDIGGLGTNRVGRLTHARQSSGGWQQLAAVPPPHGADDHCNSDLNRSNGSLGAGDSTEGLASGRGAPAASTGKAFAPAGIAAAAAASAAAMHDTPSPFFEMSSPEWSPERTQRASSDSPTPAGPLVVMQGFDVPMESTPNRARFRKQQPPAAGTEAAATSASVSDPDSPPRSVEKPSASSASDARRHDSANRSSDSRLSALDAGNNNSSSSPGLVLNIGSSTSLDKGSSATAPVSTPEVTISPPFSSVVSAPASIPGSMLATATTALLDGDGASVDPSVGPACPVIAIDKTPDSDQSMQDLRPSTSSVAQPQQQQASSQQDSLDAQQALQLAQRKASTMSNGWTGTFEAPSSSTAAGFMSKPNMATSGLQRVLSSSMKPQRNISPLTIVGHHINFVPCSGDCTHQDCHYSMMSPAISEDLVSNPSLRSSIEELSACSSPAARKLSLDLYALPEGTRAASSHEQQQHQQQHQQMWQARRVSTTGSISNSPQQQQQQSQEQQPAKRSSTIEFTPQHEQQQEKEKEAEKKSEEEEDENCERQEQEQAVPMHDDEETKTESLEALSVRMDDLTLSHTTES
jgi:hypothetical protein